jgi:hypothetical protein
MFIKFKILPFMPIKYFAFVKLVNWITGWDRSVGIATYYRLNGLRIEFQWGRDFPYSLQPPVHLVRISFPELKRSGRGVSHPLYFFRHQVLEHMPQMHRSL